MNVLATTPHYREMVLTPQSRAPWAWVVPEVMPEVASEVLPGVMAPGLARADSAPVGGV